MAQPQSKILTLNEMIAYLSAGKRTAYRLLSNDAVKINMEQIFDLLIVRH